MDSYSGRPCLGDKGIPPRESPDRLDSPAADPVLGVVSTAAAGTNSEGGRSDTWMVDGGEIPPREAVLHGKIPPREDHSSMCTTVVHMEESSRGGIFPWMCTTHQERERPSPKRGASRLLLVCAARSPPPTCATPPALLPAPPPRPPACWPLPPPYLRHDQSLPHLETSHEHFPRVPMRVHAAPHRFQPRRPPHKRLSRVQPQRGVRVGAENENISRTNNYKRTGLRRHHLHGGAVLGPETPDSFRLGVHVLAGRVAQTQLPLVVAAPAEHLAGGRPGQDVRGAWGKDCCNKNRRVCSYLGKDTKIKLNSLRAGRKKQTL